MKREYFIVTNHLLTPSLEESEVQDTETQKCHHEFYGFCWNLYNLMDDR